MSVNACVDLTNVASATKVKLVSAESRNSSPKPVRADQASEQDIPNGACGMRNDLLARPPAAAEVLGRLTTEGCPDEGVSGARMGTSQGVNGTSLRRGSCAIMAQPVFPQGSGYAPAAHLFNPSKIVKDNSCLLPVKPSGAELVFA